MYGTTGLEFAYVERENAERGEGLAHLENEASGRPVTQNTAPALQSDSYTLAEDAALTVNAPGVLENDRDIEGRSLTVTTYGAASHGTVTVNADGSLVYNPDPNYNGTDTFTYTVSDGLLTSTATVTVTITAVNDAPVVQNESYSTSEDTALTVPASGVLSNDSDIEGSSLTVTTYGAASHGTVTVNADGRLVYIPDPNYNGTDTFTYTVSDGSLSSTGTATVTMTPVNDAPVVQNESYSTSEDTALTVPASGVLSNDSDIEGSRLTVTTYGAASHGTVTVNADGRLVYNPDPNYNGTDTFTYTVSDGTLSSTATATVTLTPVNDAPVVQNESYTTSEDTALTVPASGVLSNDSDIEGSSLTVTTYGAASHGTVTVNADGRLVYNPDPNYNGTDTFTYTVSDGSLSSTATATVTVGSVNDAPFGADKTILTNEGFAYTFSVGDFGFSDPNDSPANALLAVKITTLPSDGILTLDGNDVVIGQFISAGELSNSLLVYTPGLNGNGPVYASFTFQVQDNGGTVGGGVDLDQTPNTITFNLAGVNGAPSGTDKTITTSEDFAYTFSVSDFGFSDPSDTPPDALQAVKITLLPLNGILRLDGIAVNAGDFISVGDLSSGKLVYTPGLNGNGPAYSSFTFQVQDNGGTVGGGVNLDQSPNTITFNVTPVNDAPAGTDKTITTGEDTAYTFSAGDFGFSDPNDFPANTLFAVKITTLPLNGILTLDGVDVIAGQFISASDLSLSQLVFTPGLNASGSGYASFTFQVEDNGGTVGGGVNLDQSANTITFNVTPVNDAPVAQDDNYTTEQDQILTVTTPGVLANDSDIEGNSLTVTGFGPALFGTVTMNADGSLVYVPTGNHEGIDTFTYTVSDGSLTSTATVTVTLTPESDIPVGVNDNYTTWEDNALTVSASGVLSNDTDLDGSVLIVTGNGTPSHGAVTVHADGSLVYVPDPNFNGTDTFTYTVNDDGMSSTATVTVTVSSVNDAPSGTDNEITTDEDISYTFSAGDFGFSDPNDNPTNVLFAVKITTLPVSGTLTLDGIEVLTGQFISATDLLAGQLVFTPGLNGNGFGYASFTFQVEDNGGTAGGGVNLDQSVNTITFNVLPVNDAPIVQDESFTTGEDMALTVSASGVLLNDSDIEGSSLTVTTYGAASHGTVTVNADGSLVYVPDSNYNGTDTFTYTVSDGSLTSTATATVTINALNDAPGVQNDSYTTSEDTALTVNAPGVLSNDSDIEGSSLTVTGHGTASHGAVTVNADGSLEYLPVSDYNGTDTFTYTVSDGSFITTATVTVSVSPVNDAPSGTDKTITTDEDTAYTFSAGDFGFSDPNDLPSNSLFAVKITTLPIYGTLTLDGNEVVAGQFISASDLSLSQLVYTPGLNDNGDGYASFTFQVHDNGGTANGGQDLDPSADTITFNITPVNDAPVVQDESYSTEEDTALTVMAPQGVLSNDSDIEGSSLTVTGFGTASHGTVTVNPDGSFVYVPNGNYNGTDTFTYTVSDGALISTGTATVTITGANDAPLVQNDIYTTSEDTALTVAAPQGVLSNDSDIEGSILTVTTHGAASHGTVTMNVDGSLVYTPTLNYNGMDTFTYTVSDGTDESMATVTVIVSSVNDAPSGTDKTITTDEDTAYTLSAGDFGFSDLNDLPSNSLFAVKITTLPPQGNLTLDGIEVVIGQLISVSDLLGNQLVYTPGLNDNGNGYASFTFQVHDNGGTVNGGEDLDQSADTITFNVTPVNDAPLAQNDSYTTAEDVPLTVSASGVLSNDSDVEGSSLTVTSYGSTSHGTVTVNVDGSLVYVPDSNYNGTDSFVYTVSDGSLTSTATAMLTINSVKDAMVLQNDSYTTAEDTVLTVSAPGVLSNDSDIESLTLTVTGNGTASHGTVSVNADGSLVYTPTPNYNGTDTFTYTVSDGTDESTATVTVTVSSVNDAPSGTDKTITTDEDTAYTFSAGDFGFGDPNDNPTNALFAVKITTLPISGILMLDGIEVVTGQFVSASDLSLSQLVYTPGLNGNGAGYASFTFQVLDNGGTAGGGVNLDLSANTITFNVTPVNDAPVVQDESYTTSEDTALTVTAPQGVLSNDSDLEGSSLTVTAYGTASHGTVTVNADGSLVYVPNGNYNGTDTFTYTVSDGSLVSTATATVTITAANDAPLVQNDSYTTSEDTALTVAAPQGVLSNDSDIEGSSLTVTAYGTASHGTVTVNADGSLVYVPNGNYNGTDTFTYTVSDGSLTSTATATVTVSSVNDAPAGMDKTITTDEDTAYTFSASDFGFNDPNDSPANAMSALKITTLPINGTLTLDGNEVAAGQFISVTDLSLSLLVYTPGLNGNGLGYSSFTFQVHDNGGTVNGGEDLDQTPDTITFNVTPVNDAPVAQDESYTTSEDTALTVTATQGVLSNDSDLEGSSLTVTAYGTASHGTVTVNADGSLVYVPNGNYNGTDSFTYTVSDGSLVSTATATVTITAVNDAPLVQNDSYTTLEDTALTVNAPGVLSNDIDIEGSSLTVTAYGTASHGTVSVNVDGGLVYTPTSNDNGTDTFTYTVSDGTDESTATVTVTVSSVNDAPAGSDKTITTDEDTAYTFSASDFGFGDPNDNPSNSFFAVKITTLPTSGILMLDGNEVVTGQLVSVSDLLDNQLVYTPGLNANGNGYASFTFQVHDNGGTVNGGEDLDQTPDTITFNVIPVNDAPVLQDEIYTTSEDTALTVPAPGVLSNDSDVEGSSLTVTGYGTASHGALTVNADGSLVYTPGSNYNGTDTFTYTVSDGSLTSTATATLTISAVNDAPLVQDDSYTTSENNVLTVIAPGALSNDSDIEGSSLSVIANGTALHGIVTVHADGSLVYVPNMNYNGTDSFTYTVSDGTDESTATVTVTVSSVNDAPSGTDKTITTSEDTAYTFTAGDFGFSDPNDLPADTLLAVKITALPLNGSLTLNGVAVNAGDFISAGDLYGSLLVYTPGLNGNGSVYASFTFQVEDNGGTGNGGVNLDQSPNTITFNVTPVNDAPSGTDKTITTSEDTAYTFSVGDFGFSDPNDMPPDAFLLVITSTPQNGTLTLDGNAVVTGQFISAIDIAGSALVYTPDLNGNGTAYASITFQVQDDGGTFGGGIDIDPTPNTITIDVTPVNDAPVAPNDSYITAEDTVLMVTATGVLSNDSDLEGSSLTVTTYGTASHGTVTVNADGSLVYVANSNYNGTDTFTYTVSDGTAESTATVTVSITAVNDMPVVQNENYTTLEDTALTVNAPGVLQNDSDVEGSSLTVTTYGTASHGTVTVNADGSLVYTPSTNYNGTDSFTYTVTDGTAESTATATVTVSSVNDAPSGQDKTITTNEDTAYTFSASDFGFSDLSDSPPNALQAVKITALPSDGTLTLDGNVVVTGQLIGAADLAGSLLVYNPGLNGNGAEYASFTFQVQDDGGTAGGGVNLDQSVNTITINVPSGNDAPVVQNDHYSTEEDAVLTVTAPGVLQNDSDIEGSSLTVTTYGTASHGTVTVNADGSLVYVPFGHYEGTDTFTYTVSDGTDVSIATVTVTLTPENDIPVGVDDSYTMLEDMVLTVSAPGVLLNDTDMDGSTLTVTSYGPASHGSVTVNADGSLVYVPDSNYNGTDTFIYTVNDDELSSTASVTVTVSSVNDAPSGQDNTITTNEDTAYSFSASDFGFSDPNDSPSNVLLSVKITTLPGDGTLTLDGNAVVTGQFISAADIAGSLLVYTPGLNGNGAGYASFTFKVEDNGGTTNGGINLDQSANTITIDVTAVNDVPVVQNDSYTTAEDTALTVTAPGVLQNDSDVEGSSLTVTTYGPASHGTVTVNADGSLVYVANSNYNGTDTFTYTVSDGTSESTATVTVSITAVNDMPVVQNESYTTLEDTALTV
ncbi:MAG: tandem-95 repeat protein, partial [Chlorobiaceae bacterium]|nr:tandem-95 repeat protein [Chlorobiaceae bacterium]